MSLCPLVMKKICSGKGRQFCHISGSKIEHNGRHESSGVQQDIWGAKPKNTLKRWSSQITQTAKRSLTIDQKLTGGTHEMDKKGTLCARPGMKFSSEPELFRCEDWSLGRFTLRTPALFRIGRQPIKKTAGIVTDPSSVDTFRHFRAPLSSPNFPCVYRSHWSEWKRLLPERWWRIGF